MLFMKGSYEPLEQETLDTEEPPRYTYLGPSSRKAAVALVLAVALAGCAYGLFRPSMAKPPGIKQGAGLLFLHEDKVLLLLRNSKHNNSTWGLPGGNAEPADENLLRTASREGTEEMGLLPEFEVLAEIKTRLQQAFVPTLNAEHSAHQWVDVTSAAHLDKRHPVVKLLFQKPYIQQLGAAVSTIPEALDAEQKPKKLGAGFFFVSEGEALLLTRNSSHNNATLSVPGGNVDLGEKNLRETAEREAVEELGSCPEYTYKGSVTTWRGKHSQKEFKIFLGAVSPETKASFHATLDHESLAWGWYPLDGLLEQALHPVVKILIKDHLSEVKEAFGLSQ